MEENCLIGKKLLIFNQCWLWFLLISLSWSFSFRNLWIWT